MARGRNRRHRVRFDKPVENPDGAGGFTISWDEVCTERCRIERISSLRQDAERLVAGAQSSMPVVMFHIDSHKITRTIDSTMRAVDLDGGTTFEINLIQDVLGEGRDLVVTATERAPS